ncbi:MAG: type III-B CRISPR-associated protein Cas10/Cmr2 [Clostridia bacterium]|nr:type III-B CRISPR-associated protein Cas10/Cmr2 [Clostridia bacterium]
MKRKYLYFSLGPVQGFVAQARKTRDFWAGSFILSYLSGMAMLAVLDNRGKLIIPKVASKNGELEDPFLKALKEGESSAGISGDVLISTLPNRFTASVPYDFDPQTCVEAVKSSWKKIADAVWKAYVEPVERFGRGTREIWDRQVNGFWEVTWAVEEKAEDKGKGLSPILNRRKNWRSWVLSAEPGDKCTLMGGLQEISGWVRTKDKNKQETFWKALRSKVGGSEVDERERLSAVALIKRLFPLVSYEAVSIKNMPQRYPSTPYIAAVPWIAKAAEKFPDDAREYAALASKLPGAKYREDPYRFYILKKILDQQPRSREFAFLDGNCFFEASLSNPNLWKEDKTVEDFKELRSELKQKLKALTLKIGEVPSPFYALLLMDGDCMGKLIGQNDSNAVSGALGRFSSQVPEMVQSFNGILVYAGGDDVMAMVPMDGVLTLAEKLRDLYIDSFRNTGIPENETTLSGAVVFAHYTTPLTAVIKEAHRLLDDIAKDKTGRDSLAVTVWKGSGRVLTWSAPWEAIKKESGSIIDEFVHSFSAEDAKEKQYNSTSLYNLRQRLSVLLDVSSENQNCDEGLSKILLGKEELIDFMAAEYRRSREREISWEEARKRMEKLLKICRCCWRDEDYKLQVDENSFVFDGLMLIKFLAQKGVEGR